ncbi:hypothetical protein [Primorskyibacter sp. 2E107]|uniref:hypothetical protein n=1 Tax=Primorskyibacter sp. 2E107 TaxID=3403458 RepID=UPI003AF42D65
MTLIRATITPDSTVLVSDIMLTKDQPSPDRKSMWLIAEGRVDEINYSTSGHMQKTILFNRRCLFQWAGQMIVARSIYNFLKLHIKAPFEEVERLLALEFSSKDLDAVAFSIVRINSGKIEFFGHLGEHVSQGSTMNWIAGSGAYIADPRNHPADKTSDETTEGERLVDEETSDLLVRLYHGEAGAYVYDPFRAGGWYEVIVIKDQLFHRVPYAVCYYDLDQLERSGSRDPTLAVFSRYMNDRLLIHRVWGQNSSSIVNVVKSFKDRFDGAVTEPGRYFLGGLNSWELVIQVALRSGDQTVVSRVTQNKVPVDTVEILDINNPKFLASRETEEFLQQQLERPPSSLSDT